MVKILGVCGSPRSGATEKMLSEALSSIGNVSGVETEWITVRGKKIAPCNNCNYCKREKTWCVIKDDMQELLEKFVEADAYVVASPVYVYTVTPQLLAFFSRMRPLFHVYPEKLRNKFGVAMATGGMRNGGQEMTVNTIINLLLAKGINVVSNEIGGYAGAMLWSKDKEALGAMEDDKAIESASKLVNKLAEVALIYDAGRKAVNV
ncbi:flavodoxin family protein [Sporomusa sp. KB1]|jgi:multimeric flavodoxin WrbA|uniref:flavodoxin family protein n=1 Tax=Sporomusa sp. KB1 TaxID=943346 RepID=UPI0011A7A3A8|nr:flavodoxin family protein [Sporomusa sp. KB1]TWH52053.1 multimeric flavodoxin WrbA [Sporomusa sp. KB1]